MSGLYTISISGLKEGHNSIDFNIGKEFFEQFEESEVKEGSLVASISMDKRSTHLDLVISISGNISTYCDRCLGMYLQPVFSENRLLVKFGKNVEDSDPDILSLPVNEHELNLKQHLYEYIQLSLPIKRIHPLDINGNSMCDPDMLEKLKDFLVEDENISDPRWDELKKLVNDN